MPRAASSGTATYWGSVCRTPEGASGIIVSSYDRDSGECETSPVILTVGPADDHCNPSVWIRPDGRIVVGAAGHTSECLWHAISIRPHSVAEWGSAVPSKPGGFARYSYSQMVHLADEGGQDGRLYWFFRGRGFASTLRHKAIRLRGYANWWAYSISDDLGETWSGTKILWRERGVNVPYTHVTSNTKDTLYFSRSDTVDRIDPSNRRDVMACQLRAGVFSRLDGRRICTESQLPITRHKSLDTVYDSKRQGRAAFNLDITVDDAGYPVIAFSTLAKDTSGLNSENIYHVGRWTGEEWNIARVADGGPSIYEDAGHAHYSGAMAVDRADPSIVYAGVVVLVNGVKRCDVWRFRKDAGTGAWIRMDMVSDYSTECPKSFRPVCPEGGKGPVQVLWLSGTYDNYRSWTTRVHGLAESV